MTLNTRMTNENMNVVPYYSSILDILCVTYFLTSVTMPNPQTSDMRQIR